jgi:hypothetical protein
MELAFPTSQRQTLGQEPRPRITLKEAISYKVYRAHDIYKSILKDTAENLKEIKDKVDCLQRSQVYLHNHISSIECEIRKEIHDLKDILLRRLTDVQSYEVQMAEVN